MRTQLRRVPLLAACAFALAASLSASADDKAPPAAAVAVVQTNVNAQTGRLSSPEAERLAADMAALELDLVKHIKNDPPSTFEALNNRREDLQARLTNLPPTDRQILGDRLERAANAITLSLRLNGGGAKLDPEISRGAVNAAGMPGPKGGKDDLSRITVYLGELEQVAANPANAEKFIDGMKRRYGSPKGPQAGGVAVDFAAIQKTLAVTYTPDGAPGTNRGKAKNLGKETPVPQLAPVAARGDSFDFAALLSLSAGRAGNALITQGQAQSDADKEADAFKAERDARKAELTAAGRRAISDMGGDPNAFTSLDALVAHLVRQEQSLADSMKLGNNFESMDDIVLRTAAIKNVNRRLGAFIANLWEYRGFLRNNIVGGKAAVGTKFAPWETFPDGEGTTGAQVESNTRGMTQFVGLRFDNTDGGSRFQGQAKDGRSGLIIFFDKAKKRTESLIGYDKNGEVSRALTEIYDGATLVHRESLNMATGMVEVVDFKNGKELKTTRQNTKTGDQFIRDLGQSSRFEATTKDGRREIKFLASADGAPPAISLRIEKVNTDGSFELERLVLQNGTHIVYKSPHVNQLLEGGTKNLGWETSLRSLVDTTDAKKRLAIGRDLAKETIAALGMNDDNGKLSKPLGSFLASQARDTGDLIDPKLGAPIRLFVNDKKGFLLIFTRRDGSKKILSGTFKQSTEFDNNNGLGTAFGVSGAVEVDAAGRATQKDPKIGTEYLADGSRLVWLDASPQKYTPQTDLGWAGKWEMPWTNEHEKTEFRVRRDLPPDPARAEWNADGKTWVSTKDTIDREIGGSSGFSSVSRGIVNFVPGVNHVVGFAGDIASTLYTGVVATGNMVAYGVSQDDKFLLEATASYSRNPGVKLLVGGFEPERYNKDGSENPAWRKWKDGMNQEYLGRIGDQGGNLDAQAKIRREKALALQGITERRAPEAFRAAMEAPVGEDERYDALSDYGAGTYGRRLAENGYGGLGMAVSFGESFSEGMLNPLMYVIPGLGTAAGKLMTMGAKAASPTARVLAKMGEVGLRASQYVLLTTVVGSFGFTMADNLGKVVDTWGTPEASVKAGEALADLAFMRMMYKGFKNKSTMDHMTDLKNVTDPISAVDARVSAVDTTVRAAEAAKVDVNASAAQVTPQASPLKAEVNAAASPALEAGGRSGPPPSMVARVNASISSFWSELKRGGDAFTEKARPELNAGDVRSPTHAESNGPAGAVADALSAKTVTPEPAKVKAAPEPVADAKAKAPEPIVDPKAKAPEPVVDAKAKGPEPVIDAKAKGAEPAVDVAKADPAKVKGAEPVADVKGRSADVVDAKSSEMRTAAEANAGEGKAKVDAEAREKLTDEPGKADPERRNGRTNLLDEGKLKSEVAEQGRPREKVRDEAEIRDEAPAKEKRGRYERAADWLGKKADKVSRFIEGRGEMRLARGVLPLTPAMKRNMAEPDADRNRNVRKDPPAPGRYKPEDVEDPAERPAPPEPPVKETGENTSGDTTTRNSPDNLRANNGADNQFGGGGGVGGGGGPAGGGPEAGKGPKAPSFGGFGGGGGPGGGGPGGGGPGGGGGAPADEGGHAPAAAAKAGPDVSAAEPAGLLGGGPTIPVNRGSKVAPNDTSLDGGHSPAASLASAFDGSRDRKGPSGGWSPTAMKGLGAGDSPALPRLGARAAPLTGPAAADDGQLSADTAGGAVVPAGRAGAPGAKPEEEDFSYNYMPAARHKYELPTDRPGEQADWRYLMSLLVRGAAAASIGYLIYYSELPFLLGLSRRRRDGTYGA